MDVIGTIFYIIAFAMHFTSEFLDSENERNYHDSARLFII